MGLQMLGNYGSRRAQQRQLEAQYRNMAQQYTQQAQNARNMAQVNRNNANIVRFNELERGRQGAYEQAQIRDRGRQALAQINTASAANGVQGMSIDNTYGQSQRATTDDVNASRYNTALDMYGQEIQASNYDNQAGAYDQMAGYYDDMTGYFNRLASNVGSTPAWKTFLSGIPSALQTYFSWQNMTKSSNATDVRGEMGTDFSDSRYPSNVEDTRLWGQETKVPENTTNYSTYDTLNTANMYFNGADISRPDRTLQYFGNIGNPSYWTAPNSLENTVSTLASKSVPLGLSVPY